MLRCHRLTGPQGYILHYTPRNRLSPRYINIATTLIQQIEAKEMLGQQQKHAQEKRNDNKGEVTKQ
jgi:hypothetical protein